MDVRPSILQIVFLTRVHMSMLKHFHSNYIDHRSLSLSEISAQSGLVSYGREGSNHHCDQLDLVHFVLVADHSIHQDTKLDMQHHMA
jgi:hypothetical protein